MHNFTYHQTTEIIFGRGKIEELGSFAGKSGKRILLVTTPSKDSPLEKTFNRVIGLLNQSGLDVTHFDKVMPNPTTDCISEGSKLAIESGTDLIIGLGGGSSIDAAKAISVEATHKGSAWDYLFYKEPQPEKNKLIPVIAVPTTSGTGSHVTQVSVLTNSGERNKSALYNNILFPAISVIDPELSLTVPKYITACTGFDVFCHSFESILHPSSGPYTNLMAWEAIRIVINTLPELLNDLENIELRERMAWADTLAGLCIANAGVTLPHGIGMAIGGFYPQVAHGEALAIVYPEFAKYTAESALEEFRELAITFNPENHGLNKDDAAKKAVEEITMFISSLGLLQRLSDIGMPENEIDLLAEQSMVLPDYEANPRVTTPSEMKEIIRNIY